GRYALFPAGEFARRGIPVELVVCIDVAIPFAVAAKVRHAINIYRSRLRLYPARPLRAEPDSAARVTNFDLDDPGSPIAPFGLHHLNTTTSPVVQTWVVERILEAVATAEAGRSARAAAASPGIAATPTTERVVAIERRPRCVFGGVPCRSTRPPRLSFGGSRQGEAEVRRQPPSMACKRQPEPRHLLTVTNQQD